MCVRIRRTGREEGAKGYLAKMDKMQTAMTKLLYATIWDEDTLSKQTAEFIPDFQ